MSLNFFRKWLGKKPPFSLKDFFTMDEETIERRLYKIFKKEVGVSTRNFESKLIQIQTAYRVIDQKLDEIIEFNKEWEKYKECQPDK